ncbi:monocarboxylate transporter 13 isoform X1 [Acipenser ruthenus]|uniref:monocarboxylate transporter 13 isoform X1 n=1 Tax=Acipenser ruthenus TaxID=7906 RepID=UPI00274179E0|nr:monocarboxylate transporter 13 isoform X1 [Acipenser ruthenus]XP_058891099.1 monocarboxylate transporter 13 isoform X1 [Acipenser ruthenus]
MWLKELKKLFGVRGEWGAPGRSTPLHSETKPPAPACTDGGYGWVIAATCFVVTGLTSSVVRSFGLFFIEVQEHFDEQASNISWISAIAVAVFHLTSPVASALSVLLSHRAVIMLGGLFAMLGMLGGSFGLSLVWMYLTTGVILGLGISFSWIPAQSMVNQYFNQRRAMANAIVSSGECVFSFVFIPFFQWLINSMAWKGAMVVIAGLQLNLCVCGALMRPYRPPAKNTPSSGVKRQDSEEKPPLMDFSLLKLPKFLSIIVFALFSVVGFHIPAIYLVPFAQGIGVEKLSATFLVSYWSVADLVGRLGCGWLVNLALVRNIRLLAMMTTVLGTSLMLLPIATSYPSLAAFSCFCGVSFGAAVSLLLTVLIDVVGVSRLDSALGMLMFFRSVGCLLGPPLAGTLVDMTGNYGSGFYAAGGALITSVGFLLLTDFLMTSSEGQPGPELERGPPDSQRKGVEQCSVCVKAAPPP